MNTSPGFFALQRLAFGPDADSADSMARLGLKAWVDAQLQPGDEGDMEARLAACRLRIRYGDGKDWSATDEMRPLQWLDAPIDKLAALAEPGKPRPHQERVRPRLEVMAATLLRAVYSRWQLREVLCDFWHNHFSVNAWDVPVGLALPVYDREAIRAHALGNFREMLEVVAKSPAMLWYLNNRSSRAGAPNENYARELFELHTLGRDAYLNGLYNRWRDVPGALQGKPLGYIDQDVYEAARAFTGWGMEDGAGLGGGVQLPRSGRFAYVESWHDNYQKRVLATEFDPYQPALADGQKVLDLAAFHPATARHLCRKLCVRLVADQVSDALVKSAAQIWQSNQRHPRQIAKVVAHIATSREFAQARGQKLKRPLELVASFVRATGLPFSPTEGLMAELDGAGQRLFGWPTPTGHPDGAEYWSGTNVMRRRWSLMAGLAENWWGTGNFDPFSDTTASPRAGAFVDFWLSRLYGEAPSGLQAALLEAAGLNADAALPGPAHGRRLVAWAAMVPDFQRR